MPRTLFPRASNGAEFRSVHTVKGGARLLKVGKLQTRIGPTLAVLAAMEAGQVAPAAATPPAQPATPATPAKPTSPAKSTGADNIRVPTEKLDDVLNTASEVFISRIRLASDVAAISSAVRHFGQALQQVQEFGLDAVLARMAEANRRLAGDLAAEFARRDGPRASAEQLLPLVSRFHAELTADAERQGFSTAEELTLNLLSIDEVRKRLQKNVEHLEQLSGRLQTGAMSFRMVPIASLFDRFPTQVRELARQLGKKVHLEVSGADTELDKAMINQLADPLLHILRNSLDHGVEDGPTRLAKGKPEAGRIALRAYYHGSHAVIEVRDDGNGINAERVLAKAVESGLVAQADAAGMSRQDVFQLIFHPGLSTAATVSTLSGRGVGMDVVMTAISQVQGSILVDSTPGQGTTIRMKLPLTLAVVGILLVRERTHTFAFPIQLVEEVLMAAVGDLRQVSGNTLYNHRGVTLPVVTLSNVLGFPPAAFADREAPMVILAEGERRVGVLVDSVLGRQEVLIKNLGRLLKSAPFVMGCTILSDSRLVLILNALEIVNAQVRSPLTLTPPTAVQADRRQHAVLVVDDSAIQRNHLSSLLDQAGYVVETAENGFEGLKRVRGRRFAAFCVDIVMPLMDGFEFVERLRALPDHRDVPVCVITGRGDASDRDRSAQLGVLGHFEKPVDPDQLIRTLDRACLSAAAAV